MVSGRSQLERFKTYLYAESIARFMGDRELKEEFRKKASRDPEKYYAVSVLKEEGFGRKSCSSCGRFFWTVTESGVCGDPACSGGFRFVGNSPAKEKLDYVEVWKRFASHFKKLGYEPIKRYPVAARWREDADFVQASIYNFQLMSCRERLSLLRILWWCRSFV